MNRTQLNQLPVATRLYASYRDAHQTDFVTPAYIAVVDGKKHLVFADADGNAPTDIAVADVPDAWLDLVATRIGRVRMIHAAPEPDVRHDVHLHRTEDEAWFHATHMKACETAHLYAQLDADRVGRLLEGVREHQQKG